MGTKLHKIKHLLYFQEIAYWLGKPCRPDKPLFHTTNRRQNCDWQEEFSVLCWRKQVKRGMRHVNFRMWKNASVRLYTGRDMVLLYTNQAARQQISNVSSYSRITDIWHPRRLGVDPAAADFFHCVHDDTFVYAEDFLTITEGVFILPGNHFHCLAFVQGSGGYTADRPGNAAEAWLYRR